MLSINSRCIECPPVRDCRCASTIFGRRVAQQSRKCVVVAGRGLKILGGWQSAVITPITVLHLHPDSSRGWLFPARRLDAVGQDRWCGFLAAELWIACGCSWQGEGALVGGGGWSWLATQLAAPAAYVCCGTFLARLAAEQLPCLRLVVVLGHIGDREDEYKRLAFLPSH